MKELPDHGQKVGAGLESSREMHRGGATQHYWLAFLVDFGLVVLVAAASHEIDDESSSDRSTFQVFY
uniref:Uncharacterized protein n=1 Tax=Trichogramma kaykai TaxID=54128 RepID=A0ABD2XBN2_9HYME